MEIIKGKINKEEALYMIKKVFSYLTLNSRKGIATNDKFDSYAELMPFKKINNKDEKYDFEYRKTKYKIKNNKKDLHIKFKEGSNIIVFFNINKKKLNKSIIEIKEIISFEKGRGKESLIQLCNYLNIYTIKVSTSKYAVGFWEKMKKYYKGKISIIITNIN